MVKTNALGVALSLLVACGGKSSSAARDGTPDAPRDVPVERVGPACWGLSEPIEEPETPVEQACTLVIGEKRRLLDATFTSYARGEFPVYVGELSVISDLPEHELTNPSYYESARNELSGSVAARIVPYRPASNATPHPLDPGNGLALEIVSREKRQFAVVMQSDGTEDDAVVFSIVTSFGTLPGSLVPGSIRGLLLTEAPERIDFDFDERHEARGWFYRVRARGKLFRVDPDDVTPEHALILDREQTSKGFEPGGAGLVRRFEGSTNFAVPVPEGLGFVPSECYRRVEYSLLESVNAATLASGVSDVLVSSTELCCVLCRGPECIDSGFRRECLP